MKVKKNKRRKNEKLSDEAEILQMKVKKKKKKKNDKFSEEAENWHLF